MINLKYNIFIFFNYVIQLKTKLTGDGYLKGCGVAANGEDVGLIGFGQGMYGGGRRWIGECRVGVAGRKDTGGEVTEGTGAQPLG